MNNKETAKAFNEKPAIRTIDTNNESYAISDMECYFANTDFMRGRTDIERTWWNFTPLKVILHEAAESESNMKIVEEFCDFCACYIAECEGEENVPDRATFANDIKGRLFSAYGIAA